MKRCGVVKVSLELLRELLRLDDRHEVHAVETATEDWVIDCCKIYISGPDCPEVPEGGVIPQVIITFSEDTDGVVTGTVT